ncbi:MAG: S8 family serine peptidase [Bdellovibrionota bacterium]|nr:S8 family serine peptidase [Bdellovibrionota bacterium]
MRLFSKMIPLTFALILGFGCSGKKELTTEPVKLISGDLFADRPQNIESVVVLLKLNTPSLIESGQIVDGKLVINEDAKNALLLEQQETIAKAKAVSSDIKLIFSYKFSVNAIALAVPYGLYEQVEVLGTVARAEKETRFERPVLSVGQKEATIKALQKAQALAQKLNGNFAVNSVNHINADKVHAHGIKGKGIKVGIIDTGVDFTHKMLGGNGDVAAYNEMDKEKSTPLFPNQKVVGGYDFAGPDYSPGALTPDWRIPRPDVNPVDEGGHGTHVAGSVAGIGDGINTYDGVAPEADLYALKVFGNNGGTSDTVVIAAMEWAMDPNQDLDPSDRLDVLNLSLGGAYGKPNILYALAVKNLAKAGIISVISAGNSGPVPYITGAPGTSTDAISVGASIDGMPKNWEFDATKISSSSFGEMLEKRYTASFAPAPSDVNIKGSLVYAGDAATDFSEEIIEKLKGNVALIDRGGVSFVEKVTRAQNAGAIAVVIANNQPGDPIFMGGEGETQITAVMISQTLGSLAKKELAAGNEVKVDFTPTEKVKTPEIIDTITSFSSQGPRSEDGLLKPEIVAPGYQIISASMGSGDQGVALNGTSMSAPHMAGVMALLKQTFPKQTVEVLKGLVMNSASKMTDEAKSTYSVTRQGAGLVDVYKAVSHRDLVLPHSLSLGTFQLEEMKKVRKTLAVYNLSPEEKSYTLNFVSTNGNSNISGQEMSFTLKGGERRMIGYTLSLNASKDVPVEFHEGFIELKVEDQLVSSVPVLGVSKRITKIEAKELLVHSTALEDSFDALAELTLVNKSANKGPVEIFNLLGTDQRKPSAGINGDILSRSCDMQGVGYRFIQREGRELLQIGIKIFAPVSRWQACEISVRFDGNEDGEPDQEVGGLPVNYLAGLSQIVPAGYYSALLDFDKAVEIRSQYEQNLFANNGRPTIELTYVPALQDVQLMKVYENSNLAILEIDPNRIGKTKEGRIRLKATIFNEGGVEYEDNLQNKWFTISPQEREQAFRGLPDSFEMNPGQSMTLDLTKGFGKEDLMIVAPFNFQVGNRQTTVGAGLNIVKPTF